MAHTVKRWNVTPSSTPSSIYLEGAELGSYHGSPPQGHYLINVPSNMDAEDIASVVQKLSEARGRLHPELERNLSFEYASLTPLTPERQRLAVKFAFTDGYGKNEDTQLAVANDIARGAGLTTAITHTEWTPQATYRGDNISHTSKAVRY